jgi:hypothetical protein
VAPWPSCPDSKQVKIKTLIAYLIISVILSILKFEDPLTLILLFNSKSIIQLQHWVPHKQTVYGDYCAKTLKAVLWNAFRKEDLSS